MSSLIDRFMDKVSPEPNSGCWLWDGSAGFSRPGVTAGYGMIRHHGKMQKATRVSYNLFCGPIDDGMVVRHTCDVSFCVNPNHLVIGTRLDNSADMKQRGRSPDRRGAKNSYAVMTEDDVRRIRSLRKDGLGARRIARIVGHSEHTIAHVLYGGAWEHIA